MTPNFWWPFVYFLSLQNFNLVEPIPRESHHKVLLDSIIDAMGGEADKMDQVGKHSTIVRGFGHSETRPEDATKNPNLSPLLEPSDRKIHHKTKPPVLGSLCDYEDYAKLFDRYFDLPFLNFAERLYEHKIIEAELKQGDRFGSSERAWSLCQFGGIMMQCGQKRKCEYV